MPTFAWVLILLGMLILPVISLAYLALRLPGRRRQLSNLFTIEGILRRYLVMRGCRPDPEPGESPERYSTRLKNEFHRVFSEELGQEYSASRYLIPMLMAWGATGIAIAVLVAEAFGQSLRPDTPPAVLYAVLGAFFWGAWTVIRGYARWDLMPQTFYWVLFRYILAVAYGLLASELFTAAFANLGAFVVATLPFAESLRFLRSRLSGQIKGWSPAEGHPRLGDLQGLDPSTVERLEELGVYTTQELALSDPLDLLLRSNFSPKILIDWMDQAFLYNYVGERILELRRRGIRGAIELASLRDEPEVAGLLQSLAQVLGISEADIRNLIRSLYLDNQLRLIWEVWGVFEEDATEDHAQTEGAHETHRSSEDTAPGEDGKSPTAEATPEAAEGR